MYIIRSAAVVWCCALLAMHADDAGAYSDYVAYGETIVASNTVAWSAVNQTEIDMTLEKVNHTTRSGSYEANNRRERTEPTILLLLGLSMSGLALWGRKRHQSA